MILIHISGAPGSGKSTLGKWIKQKYNIKVYDIDNLYHKFLRNREKIFTNEIDFKKNLGKDFQSYINHLIQKTKKNIVFVGLHHPDPHIEYHNEMIDLKPFKIKLNGHKFYIDIPDDQIIWQRYKRELCDILKNPKKSFSYALENPDYKFLDIHDWKKDLDYWKKIHGKENYQFLNRNEIKRAIKKILS